MSHLTFGSRFSLSALSAGALVALLGLILGGPDGGAAPSSAQ